MLQRRGESRPRPGFALVSRASEARPGTQRNDSRKRNIEAEAARPVASGFRLARAYIAYISSAVCAPWSLPTGPPNKGKASSPFAGSRAMSCACSRSAPSSICSWFAQPARGDQQASPGL